MISALLLLASAAAAVTTTSSSQTLSLRRGQVKVAWSSVNGEPDQVRVAVRVTNVHAWVGFGVKCPGASPYGMQQR